MSDKYEDELLSLIEKHEPRISEEMSEWRLGDTPMQGAVTVLCAMKQEGVCVLYNTPEEEIVIRVGPFRAVVSLSELKTEGGASIDPEWEGWD